MARNKLTKVDFQMFADLRYTELINLAENQVFFFATKFLIRGSSINDVTALRGGIKDSLKKGSKIA